MTGDADMATVSISEAARLVDITRQHFYKKYIKPGIITVLRDTEGKPGIDTAELIRVCGELKGKATNTLQTMTGNTAAEKDSKIAALETEVRLLREVLQGKEGHIADLQQSLRLLEHRPEADTNATQIEELKGQVNLLKKESIWAKLFGSRKEQG